MEILNTTTMEARNTRLSRDKKEFVIPFGNVKKICKRVENPQP